MNSYANHSVYIKINLKRKDRKSGRVLRNSTGTRVHAEDELHIHKDLVEL